jgi:hypothetical protein
MDVPKSRLLSPGTKFERDENKICAARGFRMVSNRNADTRSRPMNITKIDVRKCIGWVNRYSLLIR